MRRVPIGKPLKEIGVLFRVGNCAGLTDGQLMEQFATRRGEGAELAFTEMVARHGRMVLRACRGIVTNEHDAQDAFQATFLILARSGGSLWVRDSLGPWLHRVACRVAVRARRADERQRRAERRAAETSTRRSEAIETRERWQALHEEIDRLPEHYREPIVLCDLQERTYEEAARSLGCPIGTVKSRLARGRERLRERLGHRGRATQGACIGSSAPPAVLVETTVRDAVVLASGGTVCGPAVGLAGASVRRMAVITLAKLTCGLLALAFGLGLLVAPPDPGEAIAGASPADEKPGDLDAIRGTWMRVSTDGIETDATVRKIRMVVGRDKDRSEPHLPAGAGLFVCEWRTEPGQPGSTNRAKIDPNTNPKTLDFFPEGPNAPKICPGIYKLDGDELTICFLPGPGERPKGFHAGKRGETLDVYRRVKP